MLAAPKRWIYHGFPGDPRPLAAFESRAWREWIAARKRERKRAKRRRIIERDGLVCGICRGTVPADDVEIDHIIPLARGGTSDPANLQVTHSFCNRSKGAR